MHSIGLVAHPKKPEAAALLETLYSDFARKGATLHLESKTAALLKKESDATIADLGKIADLLIVLGGDGTILQVVSELGENIKPILGINVGSLGFLTCVSSSAYQQAIESVLTEKYVLSSRTLIQITVEREGRTILDRLGLNDAVISRGEVSRLIRLDTHINGTFLTEYNADGLIIATPTGSTAYSLSAGGPVLTPDSGVLVITPICPHVLTNRSVIVSDHSTIEVRSRGDRSDVFLTIDGQELLEIGAKDTVRVRKAERDLPLARLPEMTFFEVLRQKLKWSGSAV
jgi:NAD+ kinase